MCNPLRCEDRNPRGVKAIVKDQVRITGITAQDLYGPKEHQLLVDVSFDIDLDNPFEARRDYTEVGERVRTLIREHSFEELNKLVERIAHDLLSTYPHSDAAEVTIYNQDAPVSTSAFVTHKLNR